MLVQELQEGKAIGSVMLDKSSFERRKVVGTEKGKS